MEGFFTTRPFMVAVVAALVAQSIKVVSFMILEKRVNYRRFVQTDGSPNMHSAAFAALSLYVGFLEGFGSIEFTLALCMTAMTSVDIWNVKNAASRHAELIELIITRVSKEPGVALARSRKALSYTPIDVLSGTALGVVVALMVV
jgi:acid phosphatase family membrane protein YuiD